MITNDDLRGALNNWSDRLVPVAGLLMQVACSNGRVASEPEEHDEGCKCRVCEAFMTVQAIQNEMGRTIRLLAKK